MLLLLESVSLAATSFAVEIIPDSQRGQPIAQLQALANQGPRNGKSNEKPAAAWQQDCSLTVLNLYSRNPQDGEQSPNEDSKRHSSDSTGSNGPQRVISGRKPLRNNRSSNCSGSNNDEDEDDPKPHWNKLKIKSRCERDEDTSDQDTSHIATNHEEQSKADYSTMSDTSFFRMIDYAKSWLSGTKSATPEEVHLRIADGEDCPMDKSTNNLNHSSAPTPTASDPLTPIIIVQPPDFDEVSENAEKFATPRGREHRQESYFTGYGNPEITPVPKPLPKYGVVANNLKKFLHTPSLSPRQIVQERHRIRRHSFTNRLSHATPKTAVNDPKSDYERKERARHISEGDIPSLKVKAVANHGTGLNYKHYKKEENGIHSCDGQSFEVRDRQFLEKSGLSPDRLKSEIKSALLGVSPEITPGQTKYSSNELFWRPSIIRQLCNDLLDSKSTDKPEHNDTHDNFMMKTLLAILNNQFNRSTDHRALFNGLKIIYTYDRTSRMPLTNNNRNNDHLPLIMVHVGKPRDLSITPLRFNPAVETTEVCDVTLGNFCTVTLPPESAQHLHCYFSPEQKTCEAGDEQVVLIPFTETMSENLENPDSPLNHCQNNNGEQVAGEPATAEIESEVIPSECMPQEPPSVEEIPDLETYANAVTTSDAGSDQPDGDAEKSPSPSEACHAPESIRSASDKTPSILFRYITLDLLKNAANSVKRGPLSTLVTSLGLKSSSNVTSNKKKLCDLLETCDTKGNSAAATMKIISLLVNKLEDTMIKFELLANDLPLGTSAQERKKALISHCQSQCKGNSEIRLAFKFRHSEPVQDEIIETSKMFSARTHQVNKPTLEDLNGNPNLITPNEPNSAKAENKFHFSEAAMHSCSRSSKKKKGKNKKKKQKQSDDDHNCVDTGTGYDIRAEDQHDTLEEPVKSTTRMKTQVDEVEIPDSTRTPDQDGSQNCGACLELKKSMVVLQDSMVALKEEMLQQRAISDLVIASPSTPDKKIEQLIKNKLGPIEHKLAQLRNDLDTLRATVDNQNICLENLARKSQSTVTSLEQSKCLETNTSRNRGRIETLEVGQENLKRVIKDFAKSQKVLDEVREDLGHAVDEAKITSSSNRNRIVTLERNQEGIFQSLHNLPQRNSNHSKRHTRDQIPKNQTTNKNSLRSNQGPTDGAPTVPRNDEDKPFTVVDANNRANHRENIDPVKTDDTAGNTNRSQTRRERAASFSSVASNETRNGESHHNNIRESYRRHTALLIHDDTFGEFDGRRFNHQFNVHTFKATGFKDLRNKSKKLNNTIKRLRPDCIYIHTGIDDFLKKKSGLVSDVKELAEHLLDTTKAQICFSGLIPTANDSKLNDKINLVNEDIKNYISWLHDEKPDCKKRIFTFNNNSISGQHRHVAGSDFNLTERGRKMMYVRLREGLKKTMRLPRASYHSSSSPNRSTNRYNHG